MSKILESGTAQQARNSKQCVVILASLRQHNLALALLCRYPIKRAYYVILIASAQDSAVRFESVKVSQTGNIKLIV